MNKRMTIWANNHKIFSNIIIPVAINMVYSKNFFNFVIPTSLTFFNNSSSHPKSSKIIRFIWSKFIFMSSLVCTRFRAIFSLATARVNNVFSAKKTLKLNFSAIDGAPFSRFQTVCTNVKYFITINTIQRMHICH